MVGDTDDDFVHDALGRLTQARDDDSTVNLAHDCLARGRRIAEVVGNDTRRFVYHGRHVIEAPTFEETGGSVVVTFRAEDASRRHVRGANRVRRDFIDTEALRHGWQVDGVTV